MTLNMEELTRRKRHLGASEAPAVLGLSPWRTPADIYWDKVSPPTPDEPNAAQQSGTRLEPVILQWAAERLGLADGQVQTDDTCRVGADGILSATPDAIILHRNEGIEAKKTSFPDGWGEEGTDQIPDHYLVQVHHQMLVCGFVRVWVPVLLLGAHREEWRLYCVQRDERIESELAQRERSWWDAHVVARVPPGDSPVPPLEMLRRLPRQRQQVVLGGQADAMVAEWLAARASADAAGKAADKAKAAVLALLGVEAPADEALLPDGRTLTYYEQRSAPKVDLRRIMAESPDLYQQVVTHGTHRVLRLQKGKS